MTVISLADQLTWSESYLKAMQLKQRPQREITLQECVILTLKMRIFEKEKGKL